MDIAWGLGRYVLTCCTIKGMLFATLNKHSIVSKVNLLSNRYILILVFRGVLNISRAVGFKFQIGLMSDFQV